MIDKNQLLAAFGHRLRTAREAAGLSQSQLGRALGIEGANAAKTTVSRLERGERAPSFERVYALATACGVPASSLM